MNLDGYSLRSHSEKEIEEALAKDPSLRVYVLSTDSGDDDVLLGGSACDVILDILAYHDIDQLPDDWSVDRIFI